MDRYCWKAEIKEGKQAEYIKRHNEIWQEMKDLLKEAGIVNYSIWLEGTTVIGYYECEKGVEYALEKQKNSEVVDRWNEYMKDVLVMEMQKDGGQPKMKEVFYLA